MTTQLAFRFAAKEIAHVKIWTTFRGPYNHVRLENGITIEPLDEKLWHGSITVNQSKNLPTTLMEWSDKESIKDVLSGMERALNTMLYQG